MSVHKFLVSCVFAMQVTILTAGPCSADMMRIKCESFKFCDTNQNCTEPRGRYNPIIERVFEVDFDHQYIRDHYGFYLELENVGEWRSAKSAPYKAIFRNARGATVFESREPTRIAAVKFREGAAQPGYISKDLLPLSYEYAIYSQNQDEDRTEFTETGFCMAPTR